MAEGTPSKIGDQWGGVRMTEAAAPGDIVTVRTRAGKTFEKQLIEVYKDYDDATIWRAKDVTGDRGSGNGGSSAPATVPQGHKTQLRAAPGQTATASSVLNAGLAAYREATGDEFGIPPEQAMNLACTVAIQVGRGAENDLV